MNDQKIHLLCITANYWTRFNPDLGELDLIRRRIYVKGRNTDRLWRAAYILLYKHDLYSIILNDMKCYPPARWD